MRLGGRTSERTGSGSGLTLMICSCASWFRGRIRTSRTRVGRMVFLVMLVSQLIVKVDRYMTCKYLPVRCRKMQTEYGRLLPGKTVLVM